MWRRLIRAVARWPWWQKGALLALSPLVALNVTVALVGRSVVSPLSPFFLEEKVTALRAFGAHLPACVWSGHTELAPLIRAAEAKHRIPTGLLRALIETESEQQAHRISAAGAMGPAQLMPQTAAMLHVRDPYDSAQAVDAAARYLAANLRQTHDIRLAVAAYNAGPRAVDDGHMPQNGQTLAYVAKVMRLYEAYRPSVARPMARRR